jgi:hypothetical protein
MVAQARPTLRARARSEPTTPLAELPDPLFELPGRGHCTCASLARLIAVPSASPEHTREPSERRASVLANVACIAPRRAMRTRRIPFVDNPKAASYSPTTFEGKAPMEIVLDKRAMKQIRVSAQDAIDEGDTETLREDILDSFSEEQVEEIERRIDTDFYDFLGDTLEEWSGEDVDELFELLESQLADVGIELKSEGAEAEEEEDSESEPEEVEEDDEDLDVDEEEEGGKAEDEDE